MPIKINISEKSGKTYKLETDTEVFFGKALKDKILGEEIINELEGYEFEISGASDTAGFTYHEGVPGLGLKKVLLTYGKGMKKRPRRGGKKKISNPKPKGLRLRKSVRGRVLSQDISQINLKVIKEGKRPLAEVFPNQNKKIKQNEENKG
ncbi:MAG: S6e family ribosomal protein [Candidatus Pacearchaeota archaeon]